MKRLTIALMAVTALAACGSDVPPREAVEAGESSSTGLPVALTGCVGVAPGTTGLALRRVQFPTEEAARAAAKVPGITEDAWVQLEGSSDRLQAFVGEHVSVRGEVIDSGRNTIGTAGVWGDEALSGDTSQAASDQHYAEKQKAEAGRIARQSLANGTAAQIRVTAIERIEPANCDDEQPPEKRRGGR